MVGCRYEPLSAVAVLLIELGFDFNFVSRTYTALQKIEQAKQQVVLLSHPQTAGQLSVSWQGQIVRMSAWLSPWLYA